MRDTPKAVGAALGKLLAPSWVALACLFAGSVVFTANAQVPERRTLSPEGIYKLASKCVVVVNAMNSTTQETSLGSGVVIGKNKIVTNKHIIDGNDIIWISVRNKQWSVKLEDIIIDPDRDLALLSVEDLDIPLIKMNKGLPRIGQKIYSIGNPKGLEVTLSDGIVSGLRGGKTKDLIQITSPISPGSSGGGLFDEEGKLVGITTFYLKDGQNLNFSLPTKWIDELSIRGIAYKIEQTSVAPPIAESAVNYSEKTRELYNQKKYIDLLSLAQEWAKHEPKNAAAYQTIGLAYGSLNNYQAALNNLKMSASLDPSNSITMGLMGISLKVLGDNEGAIEAYKKSIKLNGTNFSSRENLSQLYAEKGFVEKNIGNYDSALSYFQEAVRTHEENAAAWFEIGFINVKLSRLDVALLAYENVLRYRANDDAAWFNKGLIYCMMRNKTAALDVYRKLLDINKNKAFEYWDYYSKTFL